MVRYADGPTTTVAIHIAAPPPKVWELVSDIELPARFSDEFQGAEWIDEPGGEGARFRGRNRHPELGWEWETICTVTAWDPERRLAYAVGDVETPSATWWFELEDIDAGTRLTMGMRIGPGPSGLTPAIEQMPDKEEKIIARRLADLRRNMEATVAGVKAVAESG